MTISLEKYAKDISTLKEENAFLKEQLEWFKKQLFGQKADKFVDTQKGRSFALKVLISWLLLHQKKDN